MSTYSQLKNQLAEDNNSSGIDKFIQGGLPTDNNTNGESGSQGLSFQKPLIKGTTATLPVSVITLSEPHFQTEEEFWAWLKANNISCPFDWNSALIGAGAGLGIGLLLWFLFK